MTTHEMTTPPTTGPAGDHSPTAWHTLWACFFGYMVNAMDVLIFEPAMLEMLNSGNHLKVTNVGVVLIATATFLASAAGGWLAGLMSDWFSRVRTLECMIFLFAVSTFLCGFEMGYAWLFFWRAVMGFGFGGQWAAAAVLVGEAFGNADRGRAVGFMQSGWALGWGIAFFWMPPLAHYISQLLQPILSTEVPVWRILFWLGLSPVLLIPYVHWFVEESPLIADTRKRIAAGGDRADLLELFSPEKLSTTFLTCVLSIGALCGYWAIMLWLPVFLEPVFLERSVDGDHYRALLIFGSGAGYLSSAWLSDLDRLGWRGNLLVWVIVLIGVFLLWLLPWLKDLWRMDETGTGFVIFAILVGLGFAAYLRSALIGEGDLFGRRRNFVLFAIFAIVTVFACIYFTANGKIILLLAFPLGFFASGAFSGIGAFFTELFPPRMRGMGVGFTYNFGRGFAVLILWLIPVLAGPGVLPGSSPIPLGLSIGMFVLIAYGLMVITALLLPETKGRGLEDSDIEGAQKTGTTLPATAARSGV